MENNQLTSQPLPAKITANHSDISPILEEGIRGKAFAWSIAFLEKQGRAQFGEKFRIHEADHEIVFRLLVYFLGDRYHADKLGLDLSKGILLTGPVGCGKTTLMNLMRLVPPPERNHIMKTCREVSFEFIQEGYEVIGRYSRMSFNNSRPKTYCFDDLGTEQNLKYYGNECNVMGEILLSRYEMFMHHNMITHITTNLSAGEMDDVYGSRVRSRLREMVNLVAYDRITPDKR
jgi:energy-coupling factor transporter ATP-binding protein EcfA2